MTEIGKRDHDFERAVEGMDDMTVLSMYYAQRNRSESADTRAQRAEAECERLREALDSVRKEACSLRFAEKSVRQGDVKPIGERFHKIAQDALATPPPEGGSESWAGTWDEQADVPLCDWKPGMRNTPEQTGRRMIDTESIDERYAQFERRGQPDRHPTLEFGSVALERFIHDMMGEINRLRALQSSRVPEQPGDALAAFEEVMADFEELTGIDPNANPKVHEVRQSLRNRGSTAHWAHQNPGRADQYRAESIACRRALGFDTDPEDVSPNDLVSALTASGVPEEVRRLPDRMDRQADARDDGDFISDHARGIADASRYWAKALREALASAPADGYKLVPVEPTNAMLEAAADEVTLAANYCMTAAVYRIMIAAAPVDGRES